MNHRDRETHGRIRINFGMFAGLVLLTAFALQLRAADAAPPLKLVYAHTAAYHTALLLSAKSSASFTTDLAGDNNDLTFTASAVMHVRVAYVDPATPNGALAIVKTGQDVTVNLATNSAGAIITTGADVRSAINAADWSGGFLGAGLAAGNSGSGVVTAMAQTDLSVTAKGSIGNCGGGFGYPYTLEPAIGAAYEPDLTQYLCGDATFTLLDAPTDVDTVTVVNFDNGANRSNFTIAPIGAVTNDRPSTVGPLVNVGDIHSYITTFPSAETHLRASIFGGIYLFVPQQEDFSVAPPVSQYAIQATGVYFVSVSIPFCQIGPCPADAPVYGFASDGDSRGGTFRGFPFGK